MFELTSLHPEPPETLCHGFDGLALLHLGQILCEPYFMVGIGFGVNYIVHRKLDPNALNDRQRSQGNSDVVNAILLMVVLKSRLRKVAARIKQIIVVMVTP